MNRFSRAALALLAVALVVTGCARQPVQTPGAAPSSTTATIGLTYIPDIQFAPFYVADAEGLFAENGVDATLRHHGAQEGLFTALVAGQEQFVIAGGDEVVQARAEGMDLVAIAQYYHSYPVVLIVPDTSAIESAADLAGKRVGLPGRYGESWFGLQAALAGADLTEADVEVVEIGYTGQAALTTGKVDAVVGFSNNDVVQFGLADIPVRAVPLRSEGPVPLVSIVLATTADYARSNPDIARGVAASMVDAMERVVAEPSVALAAGAEHIPTLDEAGAKASAQATLEATLPLWTPAAGQPAGRLDPVAWRDMTAFMREAGIISVDVAPEDAMTNAHVDG